MKVFSKYLRHILKSSILSSFIFTIASILFVILQLPSLTKPSEYWQTTETGVTQYVLTYEYCTTGMYLLAIVLGISATILPILCLSCFKNRRNSDTLYSLPISRFKLAAAHFLSGFIQVIFIYTCTFIAAYLYLKLNTTCFDLSHMLLYYPLSLLAGLAIYSFFAFFYTQANTEADGVIICGLWVLASHLLFYYSGISRLWSQIYSPLDKLTVIFMTHTEINGNKNYHYDDIINSSYMFAVWGVIAVLCMIGYFFFATRYKANRAEEISSSIFGYKTLLPFVFTLLFYTALDGLAIICAILMVLSYMVYRRSFRLKKQDVITIVITLTVNVTILAFIR